MNIDELTIGQAKQLSALFSNNESTTDSPSIGKYVVIRSYDSGVHTGVLVSKNGRNVVLKDTRRIWSWEGAFTLSAVAKYGVGGGKISCEIPLNEIENVLETIPCSSQAETSIRGAKEHKV